VGAAPDLEDLTNHIAQTPAF